MIVTAKYKEIFRTLRDEILSGKYSSHHSFPSSIALSRRFAVSRFIVRQALDRLIQEGLIKTQKGRGTFVTKQGTSRKIGLVVPGIAYSEFYSPLVSDLSRLCQEGGYALLFGDVYSTKPSVRAEQALAIANSFVEQGVSGVIYQPIEFLANAEEVNERILSVFDKVGIPVVLLAYDITLSSRRSAHDIIGINNAEAGSMLGEYLMGLGAHDIHFLMRPRWSPSGAARLRGVAGVMQDFGKVNWMGRNVLRANPDNLTAIRRHLRARPKADAFICGCDEDAMLLCRTLAKLRKRVPDDIMLVGFDDIRYATVMSPQLTTIRQPHDQIAAMAFRALLERIVEPDLPPREIYLPATLVERESTKKVLESCRGEQMAGKTGDFQSENKT